MAFPTIIDTSVLLFEDFISFLRLESFDEAEAKVEL